MDTKPWYASKTIWASVMQILAGVLVTTGLVSDAAREILVTDGPELVTGVIVAVFGLFSLYGRMTATKAIGVESTNA